MPTPPMPPKDAPYYSGVKHREYVASGFSKSEKIDAEQRKATSKAVSKVTDEPPVNRGPKASIKESSFRSIKVPRFVGAFKRTLMRSPKRTMLLEMLAVMVIITVSRVSEGEVPRPSDYLAPFVVYLVLGFATEFGGSTARFAAMFGLLVLLSILLAHSAGIVRGLQVVSFGPGEGPTTLGAQGVSGFGAGGQSGQGSGGGGGGSF